MSHQCACGNRCVACCVLVPAQVSDCPFPPSCSTSETPVFLVLPRETLNIREKYPLGRAWVLVLVQLPMLSWTSPLITLSPVVKWSLFTSFQVSDSSLESEKEWRLCDVPMPGRSREMTVSYTLPSVRSPFFYLQDLGWILWPSQDLAPRSSTRERKRFMHLVTPPDSCRWGQQTMAPRTPSQYCSHSVIFEGLGTIPCTNIYAQQQG